MDTTAFVQELEAFKAERLAAILGAGRTSLDDAAATRAADPMKLLQVALYLAFDAVVKNVRLRVGTHGGDNSAAGGAGRTRSAGRGHHGAIVHRAERALAACCSHGGAQGDVDVIHRGQSRHRRKIHRMQLQAGMGQRGGSPPLGMQHMNCGARGLGRARCGGRRRLA